ncbi:MAG: hypothetical protein LDLANPLL_01274 [Turneriella sp.]|nr:hypothetical protein [Turneriella sp.]
MRRRFFTFRVRINIAVFIVAVSATLTGLLYYYKVSSEQVWSQMKNRVKDFGKIGVTTFSPDDMKFLEELDTDLNTIPRALPPEPQSGARLNALSETEKHAIARSTRFQIVMQKLRRIRYASGKSPVYDPTISASSLIDQKVQIHRIWIAGVRMHTVLPNFLRVLVADEIQEIDRNNNHRIDPEESIYHIGDVFNGYGQESIVSALNGTTTVTNGYRTENSGVYISGYTPVKNSHGRIIALLVIDFSAASEFDALFGLKIAGYYIIVALLLFSILAASFTSRFLLKPLEAMQNAAAHFGQRDFSVRLNEDSADELGDLAYAMNLMAHELGEYSRNLESRIVERTREISEILDSLEQGILTVDQRGFIQAEHSKKTLSIFGVEEITFHNFLDFFTDETLRASIEKFLALFFSPHIITAQMLEQANPLKEILYKNAKGEAKFLRFGFRLLEASAKGQTKRILISIIDETDEYNLREKIHQTETKKRSEFDVLIQWMQIPSRILEDFFIQQRDILTRGKDIILNFDAASKSYLFDYAQRVHALKGNALQLDFTELAEVLHTLEGVLQSHSEEEIEKRKEERTQISRIINAAEVLINERENLLIRIKNLVNKDAINSQTQLKNLSRFWKQQINEKALSKKIPVVVKITFAQGSHEALHKLHNVIVQLIRNTFSHGIEPPKLRIEQGKKEELAISLTTHVGEHNIELVYSEDGSGFPQLTDKTAEEIPLEKILQNRLTASTGTVSLESGRGLGIEYIVTALNEMGGKAFIQATKTQTTFRFVLPR